MTWLTIHKILPSVRSGSPPRYTDMLPDSAGELPRVEWRIDINDREIGDASIDVARKSDGSARADSTIKIRNLSVGEVLDQSLGVLAQFVRSSIAAHGSTTDLDRSLELTIVNEMHFSPFGQLEEFRSHVDVADQMNLIELRGTVFDDQLRIAAFVNLDVPRNGQPSRADPVFEQRIHVSPEHLIADSLTPRPRFRQLRVGQTWTYQSYRALVPNRPVMDIEAQVQNRETIRWQGQPVDCYHVFLRRAETGGLSLANDVGQLWVRMDGTVVRQSLNWGSIELTFERLSDNSELITSPTE